MNEIAVIITVWKRNHLEEQLMGILEQTLQPVSILIIQNEYNHDFQSVVSKFKNQFRNISLIRSESNLKYFIRFSLASLAQADYIFLIDDDVIPGQEWLAICLEKCNRYNAVISCSGRIIQNNDFTPEVWKDPEYRKLFIADFHTEDDFNYNPKDEYVDYGCNSYFIRTEWMKHFWSIWPVTLLSGEDIHLSGSLMISDSIPTVVPEQTSPQNSGNIRKAYGSDEFASWRQNNFVSIRECVLRYLITKKGWTPILWNKN